MGARFGVVLRMRAQRQRHAHVRSDHADVPHALRLPARLARPQPEAFAVDAAALRRRWYGSQPGGVWLVDGGAGG